MYSEPARAWIPNSRATDFSAHCASIKIFHSNYGSHLLICSTFMPEKWMRKSTFPCQFSVRIECSSTPHSKDLMITSKSVNSELNLSKTSQTKPAPSHWCDQDLNRHLRSSSNINVMTRWSGRTNEAETFPHRQIMRKRPKLLHFSISETLHASRSRWRSRTLKWIRCIEVCFPTCRRRRRYLLLHSSPSMIRSRLNTMDELPNSPMLTGMERCSNVLPCPHHGLFIMFAQGVTLKNKCRSSFSCSGSIDPCRCSCSSLMSRWIMKPRPSHRVLFSGRLAAHFNLRELDLRREAFGSLWTPEHDFWTVSFPPPLLFIYVLLVITLQLSATSSCELVCMLPFLTWAVNNSDYGHKSQ